MVSRCCPSSPCNTSHLQETRRFGVTHPRSHCFLRRFGSGLASYYDCTWRGGNQAGSSSGVCGRLEEEGGVSGNPGSAFLRAACLILKELQIRKWEMLTLCFFYYYYFPIDLREEGIERERSINLLVHLFHLVVYTNIF